MRKRILLLAAATTFCLTQASAQWVVSDPGNLVGYYTNKNIAVSFLRARKKADTDRVMRLYGDAASRYW